MNPVARAVSSLLKSSSVWSTSNDPIDGDRERDGSVSEELHEDLRSVEAAE